MPKPVKKNRTLRATIMIEVDYNDLRDKGIRTSMKALKRQACFELDELTWHTITEDLVKFDEINDKGFIIQRRSHAKVKRAQTTVEQNNNSKD